MSNRFFHVANGLAGCELAAGKLGRRRECAEAAARRVTRRYRFLGLWPCQDGKAAINVRVSKLFSSVVSSIWHLELVGWNIP